MLDVYLNVSGRVSVYLTVRYNYCNLSIFLYIFGANSGAGIWTNRVQVVGILAKAFEQTILRDCIVRETTLQAIQ